MKRITHINRAIALGCFVDIEGVGTGQPLYTKKRNKEVFIKVGFFHPFYGTRWVSDKRPSRYWVFEMV